MVTSESGASPNEGKWDMSYMGSNLAFSGGIRELTLDEVSIVCGGELGDGGGYDPYEDLYIGGSTARTINWRKVLDEAVITMVASGVGGTVTGCLVGAAATGPAAPATCPAGALLGAATGAAGGLVTGAVNSVLQQTK